MEAGEPIERAYWVYDGMNRDVAAAVIERSLREAFEAEGWAHSPVRYETLPAGSPRVPDPPLPFQGLNPYCLLGWAEAVAPLAGAFTVTGDLTAGDLERLRTIVRDRWAAANNGERLGNEAADAVIDQLTPATVRGLVSQ
jgi:hypothetical protein